MVSRHPCAARSLATRLRVGALSKLGAEILGRALQFLLVYVAQRSLGPVAYGHFTIAVSAGLVLAACSDLGAQLTVARRLARGDDPDPAALVGAGLTARAVTTVAACLLLAWVATTRPVGVQAASFVLGVAVLVATAAELLGYVFRGLEWPELDAVLLFGGRVLTVGLGLAALAAGGGLDGLAAAYLTGAVATVAAGYACLRLRFLRPRWVAGSRRVRSLLREAGPLAVALILSMAYTRTAVFLLDALAGPAAAGTYGVAQKLTEPLAVLPAAVMTPLYPIVASEMARGRDPRNLQRVVLAALGAIAAFVAVGGVAAGPQVIAWLYGAEYAAATRPLQILVVATIPGFLNYALTHGLVAAGYSGRFLALTTMTFVLNGVLCLAWIPHQGPTGAARAMLASESVLLVLSAAVSRPAPRSGAARVELRVPPYE